MYDCSLKELLDKLSMREKVFEKVNKVSYDFKVWMFYNFSNCALAFFLCLHIHTSLLAL